MRANFALFDLSRRVAVVTGGNGGIGFAMAHGFSQAGASVAIVGRDVGKNEAARARLVSETGARVATMTADVTNEVEVAGAIRSVVAEFSGIDILVNNAGTNDRKLPQAYSLEEWNELVAVNLTSAFVVSQAVYPHMAATKHGRIINIGSMLSLFGGSHSAPYAAAKGGIVQLTKSLAQAWASDGITVNAILPGWIDTDLTVEARRQLPALDAKVLSRTPQGRWGRPEDIAGPAVFLASAAADFVTGAVIPVDGGYSSNG